MSDDISMYNQLRLQKQLCDAVVRVDGAEFHVHKVILCNCSSYFSSLFTQGSTSENRLFDIPHVSPRVMKLLIEFAYTGCVAVTPENMEELFIAADRLDVPGILEACSELVEQHLGPLNCIGVWWFADTYYYPELKQKAFLFMLAHFEAVAATSEEFLQLSEQDLAKIIESDKLTVKREETVFEAVMRWITYAPEERRDCLSLLLSKVRLALMSPEYIMQVVNSTTMVWMSKQCRATLLKAMEAMLNLRSTNFSNCIYFNPLARPRLPSQILLAMGGWSGESPTNCIEAYDVCAGRWVSVCQFEEGPRAYHGTAFLSGSVYCIGGSNGNVQFSVVHKFDLGTHTWHEVAPMHSSRCYVSVAAMDGYIYAIGGYNGMNRLKTAERYNPQSNQWTMIASMHDQRSDASCTTLHGKIYICGGFNGSECLSTAECYSPDTNQWTMITSMDSKRSGVGVIAYSRVFAVGGFDGSTRLNTAEAYNPETNTWDYVSSMLTPRSNFGIAVMDGCLFAVGGYNGLGTTADVESFDVEANEWTDVRSMEISRSALSCCLVYGLNNMADYAIPRYPPETSMEQGDDV